MVSENLKIMELCYYFCDGYTDLIIGRSFLLEVLFKKGALKFFCKIHKKTRVPESFLINMRPATLLKKRLWHICFPVNFAKFLRTPFLERTSSGCF